MLPRKFPRYVLLFLLVSPALSKPLNALERIAGESKSNFWSSYEEAMSRLGGSTAHPTKGILPGPLVPMEDAHPSLTRNENFNSALKSSAAEIDDLVSYKDQSLLEIDIEKPGASTGNDDGSKRNTIPRAYLTALDTSRSVNNEDSVTAADEILGTATSIDDNEYQSTEKVFAESRGDANRVSMTYSPQDRIAGADGLSLEMNSTADDAGKNKSGEIVNAIISTVLSLSGNQTDLQDLVNGTDFNRLNFFGDLGQFEDSKPDVAYGDFLRQGSGPMKASFVQFYKNSVSGGRFNASVSDSEGSLPLKTINFNASELNTSTSLKSNAQPILMNYTVTILRNITQDFNSSRSTELTGNATLNSSTTFAPPVRANPADLRIDIPPIFPIIVPQVNEPSNLRYDPEPSQFESLVQAIQHPSLLTVGMLDFANTVGLMGGIVSLPFLLGKRRKRNAQHPTENIFPEILNQLEIPN
ncbi:uncharacterized protein LOC108677565 [Hyalella azteca]|uniref:Uncharacterized protein LOC108677565 n=1 Tax=Hyalella azteca TaxID=294128 RepID=A0A8B7P804_HYAAZ|nr:uncharacterized protein LOC108677565 [Hyalella azteca]